MILLYPVLLITAIALALTQQRERGRGWPWFGAWCLAGALWFFSLLTGFSIGLFVLPVAGAALFVAAARAPHLLESFGFVAGVGLVAVLVAGLNWGDEQVNPTSWLAAGLALTVVAVSAYALGAREPK